MAGGGETFGAGGPPPSERRKRARGHAREKEASMDSSRSRPLFELEDTRPVAKIKVIGLGGAGGNSVNRMVEAKFTGVDLIVANTDNQALRASLAPIRVQLGAKLTGG